jgi:DNA invertase Pin-like site-specific DNA recombinase
MPKHGHGSIYGYLRLRLYDQNPKLGQYKQSLTDAGATEIFLDRGTPYNRPEFYAMLHKAKRGDTVVVVRLSHISTTVDFAVALVFELQEKGVNLVALDPPLNTGAPGVENAQNLIRGLRAAQLHSNMLMVEDGGGGGGNGGDH